MSKCRNLDTWDRHDPTCPCDTCRRVAVVMSAVKGETVIGFHPLGSVVIVLPKETARARTESGIELADVYQDTETSGLVVAVGTHFCCAACATQRDPSVRVGDFVAFARNAGAEVSYQGTTYVLLQESELLAVLDETAVCEVV